MPYPIPILEEKVAGLILADGITSLEFWIRKCWSFGIKDVFVNVSNSHKQIERFIKKNKWYGNITVIKEKKFSGTVGAIGNNKKVLQKYHNFFVIRLDALTNIDLHVLYLLHKEHKAFGTFVLKNSKLKRKSKGYTSSWTDCGVYIFNNKILSKLPKKRPLDFERDVFPKLAKNIFALNFNACSTKTGDNK